MRLVIDVREACREKRTGKGQWAYGFISELLRRDVPSTLLTDRALPAEWALNDRQRCVIFPSSGFAWHLRAAFFARSTPDVMYISPTSYLVPFLLGRSVTCVPIIHDLIAFRGDPHDKKATLIERLTLGRTVRSAAHICTVSDATTLDLLERYPSLPRERVTPIFAGPLRARVTMNQPTKPMILCVGTLSPRKNQVRLIHAYMQLPSELRERYQLVLVGARGWIDDEILSHVRRIPGVRWLDYVPDVQYEALLSSCTIVALPSLYEGFGMQVLDALQRGIPVLTSTRGSLLEVAGDAALTVDPESVDNIAEGLKHLLADEALRAELRRRGPIQASRFSWARTVDLFLGIQERISSTTVR
jgi:alpha-1,3-rhamnosyl/mannosyltransferase